MADRQDCWIGESVWHSLAPSDEKKKKKKKKKAKKEGRA
jgi:hypothetical protein